MRFQVYSRSDANRICRHLIIHRISFTIDFSRTSLDEPQIIILEPFDFTSFGEWLNAEAIRTDVVL